jgi:hypothetical protein
VAEGAVAITVKTQDGEKTAACAVTVIPAAPVVIHVESVTVSPKTLELQTGQTSPPLTATVLPANATNKAVTWNTSDSAKATVSANGAVTAVAEGTATITVETVDGEKTDSCTVTITPVVIPVIPVIPYVAGYERTPLPENKNFATLWVNGVSQRLGFSNGNVAESYAESVFVSGNDKYVAGYERDYNYFEAATLWINGVPHILSSDESPEARANSVFVSGGNVYAAGYEIDENWTYAVAKLWVNGVPQSLSDEIAGNEAYPRSVFVSGDDVYVAGRVYSDAIGEYVATLWVNGNAQSLSDGTIRATAESVFVYGGDVYVAGYERNASGVFVAKLWVNSVPHNLSDGIHYALARSVFVSGGNVYVAGDITDVTGSVAGIWVNGVSQSLSDGVVAESVFVSGDDVYVTGYQITQYASVATLWINGVPQSLSDESTNTAAFSVFVSADSGGVVNPADATALHPASADAAGGRAN